MSITVSNIEKSFVDFKALNNVNLDIETGDLMALLGPSGCGKTTLLRVIAGLETPDSGQILFHGEDTTNQNVKDRDVGFVFQHYALFRHMTVFDNVAFGLRVRPRRQRPDKQSIRNKVFELLEMVQLDWLAGSYPEQLSGGQRQRIALARALAVEPRVLLLDEPFGALDAKVRKDLRRWLRRLHDDLHVTSVFVTHDQEEALEVADRIVVLNSGRVEQVGTPEAIYDQPASAFVDAFLGDVNVFHGRVEDGHAQVDGLRFAITPEQGQTGDEAIAYARPHEIEISREGDGVAARILDIRLLGPTVRVTLERVTDGQILDVELSRSNQRESDFVQGETVHLHPQQPRVYINGASHGAEHART